MLDLTAVDLNDLANALDDHSDYGAWFLDAETGEIWFWPHDSSDAPDDDPELRADARAIDALPSAVGYGDMEDFIEGVTDRRVADLLSRAITGRGAFRRFKDTLFEFPELRQAWFSFRDARMQRRAIEFLVDESLVSEAAAREALAQLPDPRPPSAMGVVEPCRVAQAVAADLHRLYGDRLRNVVLYGSQARGDAHPESGLDLAVILEEVTTPWEELRNMDEIMWRHTLESGVTVSVTPVLAGDWDRGERPLLRTARADGIVVA